ncbi:MAG: hypothetical protein DHS20C15_33770 [Planctomycetota bacterium]|nr:MAG: hypothetical protein DHS20C15_33770 [Planctomycetota bacterium]
MTLRLGTRGSDLALWQANFVKDALHAAPGVEDVELVIISTTGDEVLDRPLQEVEGQGFFTARLERALLDDEIDLAVHSHKDMALQSPEGLLIAAVPERGPVAERLLIHPDAHDQNAPLLPLTRRAKLGTSAPRRAALLEALRHDLEIVALRGNVPTRVERVQEHRLDAVLLADAGLTRLGLDLGDLISVTLPVELMVPSPAQGALGIQCREADSELRELLARVLHHAPTAEQIDAERAVLALAGGGCHLPLGALVQAEVAGWFRARLFVGAGLPTREDPSRWIETTAATAREAAELAWGRAESGKFFGAGPLAGLRVSLVGGGTSESNLADRLEQLGAHVSHEQVLSFRPTKAPELPAKLARLKPGDVLAITSRQAARRLKGYRVPSGVTVAAVGPSTAKALVAEGIKPDFIGRGGAREMAEQLQVGDGGKVLFPCSETARPEFPAGLRARQIEVDQIVVYRTVAEAGDSEPEPADVRVYMSPSAVASSVAHGREAGKAVRIGLGGSTCDALQDETLDHEQPKGSGPDAVLHLLLTLQAENQLPRTSEPESPA